MKNNLSRVIQGCMNWGQWGSKLTINDMEFLHLIMRIYMEIILQNKNLEKLFLNLGLKEKAYN